MTREPSATPSPADPTGSRFAAAQRVAVAAGSEWERVEVLPDGEVLWHEIGQGTSAWVILTPDDRLVYVSGGLRSLYANWMRATEELVREIRGT